MAEKRPRTYDVLGNVLKFLTFPSESNGKFAMVEAIVPKGVGAPPNHHAGETEAFYVLEGQVGFMLEGKEILAGPGDHIAIPDGAVHAFQAVGDKPARILIIKAPGNMHDKFFTGIGEALPEGQTDLPEPQEPNIPHVMSVAEEVGMTILAPADAPA